MEEIRPISENRSRVKRPNTPAGLELGKIPPQATDLEEVVLGALMLEKDALTAVIDILRPETFYKPGHQLIFKAIHNLFKNSEPIDILTVTNELKKSGELELVGGPLFIAQLTSRVGSAANIEYHARIVSEKFIKRELIRICSEITTESFEDSIDVFDLLDNAERRLFDVAQGNIRRTSDKMHDLINEAIKQIEQAKNNNSGITGVPTGFRDLDAVTSGWQKSDLIILAARPGMGKTAFSLSIARNAAVDYQIPVAVFSLEMSALQLVNRLIAGETGISSEKLRKGNLDDREWKQLNTNLTKLAEAPIFINDTPGLSIFEFRAIARRLKQHSNIGLIVIDYLQLMSAGGEGKGVREQEISAISRSLKAIAKELNVPIIALSQLSRAVETRGGDKKPMLSDLRESGAIEQDADMVCFIYRPEYYNITVDEEGNSLEGVGQIIIAKHRNGALKDVSLQFIANQAKFDNLPTTAEFSPQNFPRGGGEDHFDNFEGPRTVTRPSRMNDEFDDDAPF